MGKPGIVKLDLDLDQKQRTLPEVMYSLSCLGELYEMGLVVSSSIDTQSLYQHILTSMCRVSRATGAGLLLYQPEWQRFVPGAMHNLTMAYHRLISTIDHTEMEQLAQHGPGETLVSVMIDQQHICLVTLSCDSVLYGVVALAVADKDCLLDERGMLLSYMGQVAALVLVNYRVRTAELQATISQERNRIARDLHDGLAQQLALALLKLNHVQHQLDASSSSSPATATLASILADMRDIRQIVETSLDELRRDITSLLPLELEQGSLSTALPQLVYTYQQQHPELTISYHADDLEYIPPLLEVPIFRLIQEALNNIYKHAQATHVEIRIHTVSNTLEVEVNDNGIGFEPEGMTSVVPCQSSFNHTSIDGQLDLVGADLSRTPLIYQPAASPDKSGVCAINRHLPEGGEIGVMKADKAAGESCRGVIYESASPPPSICGEKDMTSVGASCRDAIYESASPPPTCGEMSIHIGLYSMRERVQAAGGTWGILSQPGAGTTIRACFPYDPASSRVTLQ